jgi:hypothetical protein
MKSRGGMKVSHVQKNDIGAGFDSQSDWIEPEVSARGP